MAETLPTRDTPLARLVQRAPIAVFLVGTFVWAWALWGYWVVAMPPGGLVVSAPFVLCAIIGGFAPSLAAILTSWLIGGRHQVAHLLGGILRFRAPPLHYAAALGIVPGTALLGTVLLPIFVGPLKPADPSVMALAVIWPLLAALGEEFGWRGFLFPKLIHRFGLVGSALIVGVIWGVWHLPADYIGLKGYGSLFVLAFLVNGPLVLTAHALIMAWLWRRTGANLLMMVLYHWSITASAMLFPTAGGQDAWGIGAAALSAGLFWVLAIGLWVNEARHLRPAASRT